MSGKSRFGLVLLLGCLLATPAWADEKRLSCDLSGFNQTPPGPLEADLQPAGTTALSDVDYPGDPQQVLTNAFINDGKKGVTLNWMDGDTKTQVLYAPYLSGGVAADDQICVRRRGGGKFQPTTNSYVEVDGLKQDNVGLYDQPATDPNASDAGKSPFELIFDRVINWAEGKTETHGMKVSVSQKGDDPDVAIEVTPGDGFAIAAATFPGAEEALIKLAEAKQLTVVKASPLKLGLVPEKSGASTFEFFAYQDYLLVRAVKAPVIFSIPTLGNTALPLFLTDPDGKPLIAGSLLLAPRRE